MKKLIFACSLVLFVSFIHAQEIALNASTEIDKIYTQVDEPAKHPEGIVKMWEQILQELNYPKEAQEKGIKGRVFVTFVVEKDGSLSNIEIAKGIGYGCDEEAMRIVKNLPDWKPAKIDGKAVRQKTVMPFLFPPSNRK